jgi:co-chaperonin GroES (HSP10)
MIGVTKEEMEAARSLVAHGNPLALGYRLLVQQVYQEDSMEESLKGEFTKLAEMGFETKTKDEHERNNKGTPYVILLHKGPGANQGDLAAFDAPIGSVLITDRYAGVEFELPPGSGNKFRFMNDEAVLGVLENE